MLLFDSNIFIYARGQHAYSADCRSLLAEAGQQHEWMVPFLVVLELTHYYGDGGEYAEKILAAFPGLATEFEDLFWAVEQTPSHDQLNDHIILHNAHRTGADGIVSYDDFFERQSQFPNLTRRTPAELV